MTGGSDTQKPDLRIPLKYRAGVVKLLRGGRCTQIVPTSDVFAFLALLEPDAADRAEIFWGEDAGPGKGAPSAR